MAEGTARTASTATCDSRAGTLAETPAKSMASSYHHHGLYAQGHHTRYTALTHPSRRMDMDGLRAAPPLARTPSPVEADSAQPQPHLTSPKRQQKLNDILTEYCDVTDAFDRYWLRSLSFALDTSLATSRRVFSIELFIRGERWTSLIKALQTQRDNLPRAFVDLIFATDSSTRRAAPRELVDAHRLLGQLDLVKPPLDPVSDPQQCLRLVLEHAFNKHDLQPAQPSSSSTSASFSANLFHGPGLDLLSLFLQVHNPLFLELPSADNDAAKINRTAQSSTATDDAHPDTAQTSTPIYYAKVLPVLQSSGFGKSRLCVQLSTLYPGMLVCVRNALRSSDDNAQVSFPPQDSHVFDHFEESNRLISETDGNLLVHLHILAWLALYCDTLAYYLGMLKHASGCFHVEHGCPSAQHQTCWSTVVFYLAVAIHSSPSSRFVPESHFGNVRSASLCPRAKAKLDPLVRSSRSTPMPASNAVFRPADETNAAIDDISLARQRAPPLTASQFRNELLKHISRHAHDLYNVLKVAYNTANNPTTVDLDRIRAAVGQYLRPAICGLENLAPRLPTPSFAFLALDECGSFPKLLPIFRRLWFQACPAATWILLIDTNSDLAPLAGQAARQASRRMHDGGTHQLCRAFSAMPTDVNLTKDDLTAITRLRFPADGHNLSLRDLNHLLPKMGRPLWNDALYQEKGVLRPHNIIAKLLHPADWRWPNFGRLDQDSLNQDSQNALALASQRIRVDLTTNSGTDLVHTFLQHQIAQHLRYVGFISSTSETIVTSNPSEPALSAAAAWFFRSPGIAPMRKWGCVVQALVNARAPLGIDVGAQGEQGVMLLCTMAADLAATDMYPAQLGSSKADQAPLLPLYEAVVAPIRLSDWLNILIGKRYVKVSWQPTNKKEGGMAAVDVDAADYEGAAQTPQQGAHGQAPTGPQDTRLSEFDSWAQQTWINFKHVVVLDKSVNHDAIDPMLLPELWLRHAAVQGPSGQVGWDLLIPAYHHSSSYEAPIGDGRFDSQKMSYVAIQVKNWSTPVPKDVKDKPVGPNLMGSMQPTQCVELFLELGVPCNEAGNEYSIRRFAPRAPHQPSTATATTTTAAMATATASSGHQTGKGKKRARDVGPVEPNAPVQLRHHFYVRGSEATTFPLISKLLREDQQLISLLLGRFDSVSDFEFEKAKNQLVRRSSKQQQGAWHAEELRRHGLLVRLSNLSN